MSIKAVNVEGSTFRPDMEHLLLENKQLREKTKRLERDNDELVSATRPNEMTREEDKENASTPQLNFKKTILKKDTSSSSSNALQAENLRLKRALVELNEKVESMNQLVERTADIKLKLAKRLDALIQENVKLKYSVAEKNHVISDLNEQVVLMKKANSRAAQQERQRRNDASSLQSTFQRHRQDIAQARNADRMF